MEHPYGEETVPAPYLTRKEYAWSVEWRGFKVYTHHPRESISSQLHQKGVYEQSEFFIIDKFLRGGMVAVDVGANIGLHSLFLSEKVGPGGLVLAFEPDPENFRLLQKNLAENESDNVWAVRAAVGADHNPLPLYKSPDNFGDHRVFALPSHERNGSVKCLTLDGVLDGCDVSPDLIKIDVQGSELNVLAGARKTLWRAREAALLMELWPLGIRQAGGSWRDVERLLVESGFNVWLAIDGQTSALADFSTVRLSGAIPSVVDELGRPVPEDQVLINLLLLKTKRPLSEVFQ